MSDTLAPVERARVPVPTKNDVLETRKEAIQTSIESSLAQPDPYAGDLASLGNLLCMYSTYMYMFAINNIIEA